MVKYKFFLLAFIPFLLACAQKETGSAPTSRDYHLVWADEFDEEGHPDSTKWTYELGFVRNEEAQWYQPENAFCENGLLIIEGRRERKANSNFDASSDNWRLNRAFADYTAASLKTQGLHDWQYGRFEMRARIDTSAGLWPAFWTLGVENPWPHNGEIDIMEFYRGDLLANFAWGTDERWKPRWDDSRTPISTFENPDWTSDFHVWRMDWTADSIKIFVDDYLLNDVSLENTVNEDGSGFNPFQQPHYILVNLAIGGTNGGDPSQTTFPTRYEIDYIRVYQ